MSVERENTDPKSGQSTRPPQDLEMERVTSEAVGRNAAPNGGTGTGDDILDRPPTGSATSSERGALIEALNDDLRTEFQSIVQYVQHVASLKGAEYLSTISELRSHLTQELGHALVLAEQVDFLGGIPTVHLGDVPVDTDAAAALRRDLDLETSQLDRYRQRVAQANEMGLPDVAEALRPLLDQTQEHVRDLRTALGV